MSSTAGESPTASSTSSSAADSHTETDHHVVNGIVPLVALPALPVVSADGQSSLEGASAPNGAADLPGSTAADVALASNSATPPPCEAMPDTTPPQPGVMAADPVRRRARVTKCSPFFLIAVLLWVAIVVVFFPVFFSVVAPDLQRTRALADAVCTVGGAPDHVTWTVKGGINGGWRATVPVNRVIVYANAQGDLLDVDWETDEGTSSPGLVVVASGAEGGGGPWVQYEYGLLRDDEGNAVEISGVRCDDVDEGSDPPETLVCRDPGRIVAGGHVLCAVWLDPRPEPPVGISPPGSTAAAGNGSANSTGAGSYTFFRPVGVPQDVAVVIGNTAEVQGVYSGKSLSDKAQGAIVVLGVVLGMIFFLAAMFAMIGCCSSDCAVGSCRGGDGIGEGLACGSCVCVGADFAGSGGCCC
jgi:hypothetical protein